jgi:hypothetical protein
MVTGRRMEISSFLAGPCSLTDSKQNGRGISDWKREFQYFGRRELTVSSDRSFRRGNGVTGRKSWTLENAFVRAMNGRLCAVV